jgi:putative transcriptional regulator
MPQLRDPNFRRSVVLLVHHGEEGTFGVVLNRQTELTAKGLCSTLEVDWRGEPQKVIRWGGPVQPQTGWLLFGADVDVTEEDDVKCIGDGVRFAGSLDVLRRVAQDPPQDLHVMLGYAGWGPGQLENELSEGAWLIAPVTLDAVFDVDASVMWDHVLRSLGIEPSTLIASRGIH